MAASYARGRTVALDAILSWRDAVAPHVEGLAGRPLLDVGAGTGVFAGAFATWFDARVICVEPAAGMRQQAATARADRRVRYVGGTAEHLPLRRGTVAAAWISTVIHHIGDLAAAARELARVLDGNAAVLIRNAFPDRLDAIALLRYFVGARRIAATFPTIEATTAAFASAGFILEHRRAVPQVSAPNLAAAAEYVRTMRHADSTLRPLSDAEIATGMASIEADAARDPTAPVIDELDLVVFRRSPRTPAPG